MKWIYEMNIWNEYMKWIFEKNRKSLYHKSMLMDENKVLK